MKRLCCVLTLLLLKSGFFFAQEFRTVKIDKGTWMVDNLNVDHFQNGDLIPEAKTNEEWVKALKNKKPAWCYYNNDPANGEKYGKLYNVYAVVDKRGLAPLGWHIPNYRDWNDLIYFLGKDADTIPNVLDFTKIEASATPKLKNTSGWSPGENGNNESGFSALPGGYRYGNDFLDLGSSGYWHEIDVYETSFDSSGYRISNGDAVTSVVFLGYDFGLSVRCVKDFGQSEEEYNKTSIGDQVWMVENLNVEFFRNGDRIPQAKTKKEWVKACKKKQPVWSYCDYDRSTQSKVGKMYNFYAIIDERGLSPEGWHIPELKEWEKLIAFCGGDSLAAIKLKSSMGWYSTNGNNETNFSAIPVGQVSEIGEFSKYDDDVLFWTIDFHDYTNNYPTPTMILLGQIYKYGKPIEIITSYSSSPNKGFSVRCIKD
jgi:uncharacterized protein (TIGR02145 family)